MTRTLTTLLALFLSLSCAHAEQPPAPGQPQAPVGLDPNPALDALHQRGVGLKDFTGDVALSEIDALTGDTTTQRGKVWYQARAGDDSRLRVSFSERQIGPRVDKKAQTDYFLQDGWLSELDHKRKLRVDRQVLKEGEKMNLFELGRGPFPLPIGQPKEKVHEMFDVKRLAPAKDDPADTTHLLLIPRPDTRFARRFKTFDVWVDNQTNFPKKIQTKDPNQTAIRSTEFTDLKVNAGVQNDQFIVPQSQGWDLKKEPMDLD